MDILSRLISEAVDVNRQLGRLGDDYDPATVRVRSKDCLPRSLKLRTDELHRYKAMKDVEINAEIGRANANELRTARMGVDRMWHEARDRRLQTLSGTSPWEIELPLLRRKIEIGNEEILLSSLRNRLDQALLAIHQALLAIEWKNYHETNRRRQSSQVVPLDPVTSIKPAAAEPLTEEQLKKKRSLNQTEAANLLDYSTRYVRTLRNEGKLTPAFHGRIVNDGKLAAMIRRRHNPVKG